ncbi:hypothetical protein [Pseudomonas helleri]|uniref:hypothetical protein n=1 Tax=Pseudomonas helleri TaxID=1608996 RepID=UPI00242EA684|nr:hypothetical protein [Pseudomonas helleri]
MSKKEPVIVVVDKITYRFDGSQRITVVNYSEFSSIDFIPPATFFVQNAVGHYVFIHTARRNVAQEWVDKEYGRGRYTVKASKLQKGKELGENSRPAYGTATRRGQKK